MLRLILALGILMHTAQAFMPCLICTRLKSGTKTFANSANREDAPELTTGAQNQRRQRSEARHNQLSELQQRSAAGGAHHQ